jgi:periplasmic protein TonB
VEALGRIVVRDDPMDRVLGLDAKTSGVGAWLGFGSGGTLAAAAMMALAGFVAWLHTSKARMADVTQDVDLISEAPPPPPPPSPESEPEAKPAPRAFHEAAPTAQPPPPAQPGKVLSQEPDPKEPVDLTGNVFVQGSGDAYVGGPTSGTGTGTSADRAGYGPPAGNRGAGPLLAAPSPPVLAADLSREASIGHWSCSDFPEEADSAGIDEAYVMIQADVSAGGTPTTVRVLQDPGSGFGAQARRCAMRQHFQPALDREGNPMPGTTKPFRVHFSR